LRKPSGAGLAMKNGAKPIEPLVVVVRIPLAMKLLAGPSQPLRAVIGV
jgi:hypothetical protein